MEKRHEQYFKVLFLASITWLTWGVASGQTVSLNLPMYEEALRRGQLLGEVDSTISFMVRPLTVRSDIGYIVQGKDTLKFSKQIAPLTRLKIKQPFDILPTRIYGEYNTNHPFGWNNGSLLRSAGAQTQISGGVFAKLGPVHLQLRPEINYVQSSDFDGFYRAHPSPNRGNTMLEYYYTYFYNRIDLPETFDGTKSYQILPGQSSVKYSFREYAVGISTENLWWGPAKRNSLLMSNNARGFAHLSFHTTRPVKTTIGAFEGQLIAGRLESSGLLSPQYGFRSQKSSVYNPKEKDWRYLSGVVASYSPKWVPGLFVGFARVHQQYAGDVEKFDEYVPFFTNFNRPSNTLIDNLYNRDRYSSVYVRWLWKEANAESYFEYGRNKAANGLRDLVTHPERTRAYTFGLVKLRSLARKGQFIQVHAEITQMQQSVKADIREGNSWYTHSYVRHGYTHRGEVLGAGIGPGSNVQYLEVSWLKGMNKIGLQLERLVNNNDFYYYAFEKPKDFRRHWVDLGAGINISFRYKQFLVGGGGQYIRTLNYWWELNRLPTEGYFVNGRDVTNIHLKGGITYLLK